MTSAPTIGAPAALATRPRMAPAVCDVCEAVRELGITHVYADSLTFHDELNAKWEETTPGLRNLDPMGPGWRKVDEGGSASLWEFSGCG